MKREPTVIEITDTHIKLLQSKTIRGKEEVSLCDVKILQRFTDEEIMGLLSDITMAKRINADQLVAVIPRRLAILKHMKLPSTQDSEIHKMVGFQLVNQIPYTLDDVVYDQIVLEREASGYTRVLVMVIHKEVIQRYLNFFNKWGIKLKYLTISSLGLMAWLAYQEKEKSIDTLSAVVVMNIDVVHTEICFCYNQKLIFSRNIALGARDLNEENMVGLLHQLELSLGSYKKENMGPEVSRVVIVSSFKEVAFLKERIEEEFKLPAQVLGDTHHIAFHKNVALASYQSQGVSFSVCLGLVQTPVKNLINFIPSEVQDTEKSKLRQQEWVKLLLFLFVALALSAGILGVDIFRKEVFLKQLEKKHQEIKLKVTKAKGMMDAVTLLDKEFSQRIFVPELVEKLYQFLPQGVTLRTLELDEKGFLTLQGYAKLGSEVNTLQSNLVKSANFKEVNLQFATKRKIFNYELTDFKITLQISFTNHGEEDDFAPIN